MKISLAVFMSKLPVGSSAKIICGSLIIALAIATLWASPPDNCDVKWFNLCESPILFTNFSALVNASLLLLFKDKDAK